MSSSCVSSIRMRAFLAGHLASDDDEAIARHLDECRNCEQLAAELSDDEEARELARVKRPVASGTTSAVEVDDLRRRLHALGLLSMALESAERESTNDDDGATEIRQASSTARDAPRWQIRAADTEQDGHPPLTQLGSYDVVRSLGAGSFGIVYLAEDRRLRRRVAIKVARASVLTDPTLRQRFFREAEALARLEHPHILPVYEADEIEGLCYLALAYCDGPTLDQWLHEQSVPLDHVFATQLMLPLVEAVEHAHSRGILHRDIKPANILLSAAETTEALPFSPKLTDFGLAKVIEEKGGQTLAGMVLGTVHYMAPEQAAGHVERIGPATDVYSLGAVLYQLITGRLPIEGNSTIDTLRRLLIDEPPEAGRIVKSIPDDLCAIVHKCLQKSPSQRYASAAELNDDLQRFLAGRPTKARPLTPIERLSRWVRRHKTLATLLTLAATIVGLSLGLFYYAERLSHSQSQARQAALRLDLAQALAQQQDAYVAQHAYANELALAGKSTAHGDIAHATNVLRRQIPLDGKPDLRGLEWHYLWALNTYDPRVFADAGNEIYHMCLSPNGNELAAVGSRSLLRIYDSQQLEPRFFISTGQGETNCVAFSPNGKLAATAGDDGTVRIFDLASRTERLKIQAHPRKAFGVVFFEGQTKLASCGAESVIRLWDANTGEPVGTLENHEGRVEAIALSPNRRLLASAGSDKTAVLWNLANKKMERSLVGHREPLMSVCFSPDGNLVATGAIDNSVMLWTVKNGKRQVGAEHLDKVQSIAFSADGSRLYVGDRSGAVHQYRVHRREPSDTRLRLDPDPDGPAWHAHDKRVWCVVAGNDPDTFYTAGADHLLRRWERRQHAPAEKSIPAPSGDVYVDLEYSPDGQFLFALAESGGVTALDATTLEAAFSLGYGQLGHGQAPWRKLKVLPGRDEVAAGNAQATVAIWNYKTGELRHVIAPRDENSTIRELAYCPLSGRLAVSIDLTHVVRIYDVETGRLVGQVPARFPNAIALSPDGRHIAIDSLASILLIDIQTWQTVRTFSGHTAVINSIAFSPDGTLIASGSIDRTVRLWTTAGKHQVTLTSHLAAVNKVAFTPDGRTLLSLDDRGAIEAAHVAARQAMLELPIAAEKLQSLAFSPDSRRFATIRTRLNKQEVVVLGPATP